MPASVASRRGAWRDDCSACYDSCCWWCCCCCCRNVCLCALDAGTKCTLCMTISPLLPSTVYTPSSRAGRGLALDATVRRRTLGACCFFAGHFLYIFSNGASSDFCIHFLRFCFCAGRINALLVCLCSYAFRRHFYQHAGFRYVESEEPVDQTMTVMENDPELARELDAQYTLHPIWPGCQPFAVQCADLVHRAAKEVC